MFKVAAAAVIAVGSAMLTAAINTRHWYFWVAAGACLLLLIPVLVGVWQEEKKRDPLDESLRLLRRKDYHQTFAGAVNFLSAHSSGNFGLDLLAVNLVNQGLAPGDKAAILECLHELLNTGLLMNTSGYYPDTGNHYTAIQVSERGRDAYTRLAK